MDPSQTIEVDTIEEAHEAMYRLGWTDGLPVIPPTPRLVEAALEYLGRDPQEVVGEVPPKNRLATVEKVVVNSVMAGCLPEYIPVVIAALEGMLDDSFNLNGIQATTNCISPLAIVTGPVVEQLGFNAGDNVFGGGSRPTLPLAAPYGSSCGTSAAGMPEKLTAPPWGILGSTPTVSRRTRRTAPGAQSTRSVGLPGMRPV